MGWPHFAGGRLQSDGLSVGYTVANLGSFSATDPRRGVEHLDGEIGAAELLDGCLIIFALPLCLSLFRAMFVSAICLVARKQNPADVGGDDKNQERSVDQRIPEDAFLWRLAFLNHDQSLPGQGLIRLHLIHVQK